MERFTFIKPTVSHIPSMQELVRAEVINGNILERSASEMATTIRSYTVVYKDDELIGFVALHIHTPELAEIRSLVVHEQYRKYGVGSELIQKAVQEAKHLGIKTVLVLTYRENMFKEFGFKVIAKESIPETKIWADCVKCKHFPICDEVALVMEVE